MAATYKVLGQVAPSATTDTTLYTVPTGAQAVVSTLFVANRGGAAATYRIAVRPGGETLATKHYIAFGAPIAVADSAALTFGLTLGAGDVVTVYASTADLSFNLSGTEIL